VIQSIYTRHHLHDEDIADLVCPMLSSDSVNLLREVYNWTLSDMDVHSLDEQKYMLCKKIAEVEPVHILRVSLLTDNSSRTPLASSSRDGPMSF
jgi:hypothetical protein